MKRTIWGLFAALALAFIGLAPSQAQATVTCQTVAHAPAKWPDNVYWYCGPVKTSSNNTNMQSALSHLGTHAKTNAGAWDAAHYHIFVFANKADFDAYILQSNVTPTPPAPNDPIPPKAGGFTYNNGTPNYTSLVFEDRINAATHGMEATVVHEVGHFLDHVYAPKMGGTFLAASQIGSRFQYKLMGMNAEVQGGPVLTTDVIKLTISSTGVMGVTITYSPQVNNEQLATIATNMAAMINNPSGLLHAHGFVATAVGANIEIQATEYSVYSASTGGTAHEHLDLSNYDFRNLDAKTPQCGANGVFTGQRAPKPTDPENQIVYICSGATGTGTTLNTTDFTNGTNRQVLQQAWPYFFTPKTDNVFGFTYFSELFAELTSAAAGEVETGTFTPDSYVRSGYFTCAKKIVSDLESTGNLPTSMPTGCQLP